MMSYSHLRLVRPVRRRGRGSCSWAWLVMGVGSVRVGGLWVVHCIMLCGWVVTVDPGIVVVGVTGLMKLTAVVMAGVCDVVASTCVALVGQTVALTVMVMASGIRQVVHVHIEEQSQNQ